MARAKKGETIREYLGKRVSPVDINEAQRTCRAVNASAKDQAIRMALAGHPTTTWKYLVFALEQNPPEIKESEAIGLVVCAEVVRLNNLLEAGLKGPREIKMSESDIRKASRLQVSPKL